MEEKKKMQHVSFRTVGEMLDYLPDHQQEIVERLRELVFECLPQVKEKLSFNAPFYSLHKNVCFIWPGAVGWGGKTRDTVDIGFSYGYLLQDESGFLKAGDRKYVHTRTFQSLEEIKEDLIRHFLFESAEIDEMLYREKMMNRKKRNG